MLQDLFILGQSVLDRCWSQGTFRISQANTWYYELLSRTITRRPTPHKELVIEGKPSVDTTTASEGRTSHTALGATLSACGICGIALCFVLDLLHVDLRVPFVYEGDALFFLPVVKSIAQGDWITFNSRLGMPFGADLRDFPLNMNFDSAVIKLMSFVTRQPGLLINLFWLLTLIVTAGLATWCLSRLRVHPVVATIGGVIYALQPFAFYRGIAHLNLVFYNVPLLATAALELGLGRFDVFVQRGSLPPAPLRSRFPVLPIYAWVACIIQALSYIYYTFFACFLFVVASALAGLRSRCWRSILPGVLLIGTISFLTVVSLSPSLIYWMKAGKNPAMAYKEPAQADVFALKIRQMLTPNPDHPLRLGRAVAKRIADAHFPNELENVTSRLGTFGALGFLLLLGVGLMRCLPVRSISHEWSDLLGVCWGLTFAALLVATSGGLGSIFNTFVAPDIRAYNRIVVFVNFYAIIAMAVCLTRAAYWWNHRNLSRYGFAAFMGVILIAALADQVDTSTYINYKNYKERAARLAEDAEGVKEIESVLPMNAMVFQLPNTPFPAEAPPGKMSFYDHARAYLYSRRYRWSWAGMMGRNGEWTRETAAMPPVDMLNRLTAAGFSGLWLDLNGYESGKSQEADFTRLLGVTPLRIRGGRILFYDLREYNARLRQAESPGERARTLDRALHPVETAFSGGFSVEESNAGERWRWSDRTGKIVFHNPQDSPRQVVASMDLQTGYPEPSPLTITGGGKIETLPVGVARETFSRQLTVPAHGEATLSFSCACRKIIASDPRSLYFRIYDFTIHE